MDRGSARSPVDLLGVGPDRDATIARVTRSIGQSGVDEKPEPLTEPCSPGSLCALLVAPAPPAWRADDPPCVASVTTCHQEPAAARHERGWLRGQSGQQEGRRLYSEGSYDAALRSLSAVGERLAQPLVPARPRARYYAPARSSWRWPTLAASRSTRPTASGQCGARAHFCACQYADARRSSTSS